MSSPFAEANQRIEPLGGSLAEATQLLSPLQSLDWLHRTMTLTVFGQFGKGLGHCEGGGGKRQPA